MKKFIIKALPILLILLTLLSLGLVSVSAADTYTNSKGYAKVVCGSYRKTFYASKYNKNFCRALDAALNTARKKSTSKKKARVIISKGHYKLDRTIKVYSNTTLVATGSYFRYCGNLLRNGFDKRKDAGYGYTSAKNITIKGGEWEQLINFKYAGSSDPTKMHSTFRFAHCNNIKVLNAKFKNNYNGHDIEIAGVKNADFSNNYFYNKKSVNGISNNGGREAFQIDVTTQDAMPYFPSYDKTPCKNISIHNNTFKNKFRAVGSHHAVNGKTFNRITVRNNKMINIAGISVYAVYWTNSKIYSNKMTDVGFGVDLRSMINAKSLNFYNLNNLSYKNSEKAVSGSKTYIYDNLIKVRGSKNIISKTCGIRASGDYYKANDKKTKTKAGIYKIYNVNIGVDASGNSKPNTISGNLTTGILLNYGINSVVKNNIIDMKKSSMSSNNGVELSGCKNTTVSLNTIKNGTKSKAKGINAYESGAGTGNTALKISNNTIDNFSYIGIYLRNSSATDINENNISAKLYSVYLKAARDVNLRGNTLKGCYGVRLNKNCYSTDISGNTINSDDECVYFNGSSSTNKSAVKTLNITGNTLNCPSGTAAVRVVYDKVAATIHSNNRSDAGVPYYRFKGDGKTSYRKQYGDMALDNLTLETTDEVNLLSWSTSSSPTGYHVYVGEKLYKSVSATECVIDSYHGQDVTVIPYKAYGNITHLGVPKSVN